MWRDDDGDRCQRHLVRDLSRVTVDIATHPPHDEREDMEDLRLLQLGLYYNGWPQLRTILIPAAFPRLIAASPLRWLSADLIHHIAKLAHRPRMKVAFHVEGTADGFNRLSSDGQIAYRSCTRDTIYNVHIDDPRGISVRMRGTGKQYASIIVNDIWHDSVFTLGSTVLQFTSDEGGGVQEVLLTVGDAEPMHVQNWSDWSYCEDTNEIALAFDFDKGCVRWFVNGMPGPETPLDAGFEEGVSLVPHRHYEPHGYFMDDADYHDEHINDELNDGDNWRWFMRLDNLASMNPSFLIYNDPTMALHSGAARLRRGCCPGAAHGCTFCEELAADAELQANEQQ